MPKTMTLPLFELYTVSALAGADYPNGLLPYKESYLDKIKQGRMEPNSHFKLTVAKILNRTVADLFGPQKPAP